MIESGQIVEISENVARIVTKLSSTKKAKEYGISQELVDFAANVLTSKDRLHLPRTIVNGSKTDIKSASMTYMINREPSYADLVDVCVGTTLDLDDNEVPRLRQHLLVAINTRRFSTGIELYVPQSGGDLFLEKSYPDKSPPQIPWFRRFNLGNNSETQKIMEEIDKNITQKLVVWEKEY